MHTVIELIPAFEANQGRNGRTQSTIEPYHRPLMHFAEWAGDRQVDSLEPRDMETYLDHYEAEFFARHGKTPAQNTRRKVDQAIRNFFKWAERFDYVVKTPMRQIDPPPVFRKQNDWLRPEDDKKVLDACMTRDEYLAIYLLRFTGLRASEAVNLRWSNIEWQNKQLWVSVTKSKTARGIRRVPVPRELAPLLVRPGVLNQEDAYIFQTRTGKPWHRNQLYAVVRRVGKRAGVDLYPHRLRKTLGSAAFNAGADLSTISRILGHSSTTITEQAYAELTHESVARDFLDAVG
jgi:integrase/recombinase XerD